MNASVDVILGQIDLFFFFFSANYVEVYTVVKSAPYIHVLCLLVALGEKRQQKTNFAFIKHLCCVVFRIPKNQ